jgi:hypothetical protein
MAKKLSKAAQLRAFITANPTLSSSVVADKFGVKAAYVSSVKWHLKKTGVELPKVRKFLGVTVATDQISTLTDEQITRLVDNSKKPKMRMISASISNKPLIMEFTPPSDPVNHPAHYKAGGIETIDFIEAKKLGYNLGNVVKYITRADLKGNTLQDLRKAQWYLERAIWNVENRKTA